MNAPGSTTPTPATPVAPAAAPPEPPRPAPEATRLSRRSFLAAEGGLMLLSLVLAVMVWYVVRDLVDEEKTPVVTVVPLAPQGHVAVAEEKVTLRLRGKRGDIERALTDLAQDGDTVRLKVAPLLSSIEERPFDERDGYQFPFPARLLDGQPPLPPGEVVRLVERVVRVREPELAGARPENVNVRIELSRPTFTIVAPAKAVGTDIEPDPIDVRPMMQPGRNLSTPVVVPLTFERWRRADGVITVSAIEQRRLLRHRADVALPEVTATLRFEVAYSSNLPHAVEVILKRGYEVRAIMPAAHAAAFTGTLEVSEEHQRLEPTFTGKVMATQEILKDLEEHTDGWRWVLNVPESDLPTDNDEPKEVTAHLEFVAFERFHDLEAHGYIRFEPLNVPVLVVRTR